MRCAVNKYEIHQTLEFTTLMPEGASVVAIGIDGEGKPHMWAKADPYVRKVTRIFRVLQTGALWDDDVWTYVGSYATGHGVFQWHLLEKDAA